MPAPTDIKLVPSEASQIVTDPELERVVAGIQGLYEGLDRFRVPFEQADTLATMGRTKTTTGTFWFEKPGKMRWAYEKPEKERKLIVVDGEMAWIYLPAESQVYRSRVGEAFQSQTLVTFLSGLGRLDEAFHVRLAKDDGVAGHRLNLLPRDDAQAPEMDLVVARGTYEVRSVTFGDPFGNTTTIRFGEVDRKPEIPADHFTFEVPDGVTVIDADEAYQ